MDAHSLGLPQEWLNQSIVINRPEYIISFGQFGPCTFVHTNINKWSPEIKERLSDEFDLLFYLHGGPLYVIAPDDKVAKFAMMFGFEPTGVTHENGEVYIKKE